MTWIDDDSRLYPPEATKVGQTDSPGNDVVIAAARLQSSLFFYPSCVRYTVVCPLRILWDFYMLTLWGLLNSWMLSKLLFTGGE